MTGGVAGAFCISPRIGTPDFYRAPAFRLESPRTDLRASLCADDDAVYARRRTLCGSAACKNTAPSILANCGLSLTTSRSRRCLFRRFNRSRREARNLSFLPFQFPPFFSPVTIQPLYQPPAPLASLPSPRHCELYYFDPSPSICFNWIMICNHFLFRGVYKMDQGPAPPRRAPSVHSHLI